MTPSPSLTTAAYKTPDYWAQIVAKQAPNPTQGKFASDLYLAIQHHQPLSLIQKAFIVASLFPGPFSWKLALFSYLSTLTAGTMQSWELIGLGVLSIVVILIVLSRLVRSWITNREKLVFLELAFPSTTAKSAHATEQLLTLFHALASQRRFLQRFVGSLRRYSLEIVASRAEGIRYIVSVPTSDLAAVHRGLLSYLPGLKIRGIPDYLPATNPGQLQMVELQQQGDFALPLQTQKLLAEHDPIAYLTGAMTKLKPDEFMAFQLLVTPVLPNSHRGIARRIKELNRLLYRNEPLGETLTTQGFDRVLAFFNAILFFVFRAIAVTWDTVCLIVVPGYNEPQVIGKAPKPEIHNPIEAELRESVKGKIDQPLYVSSLRLFVKAETASERIASFLATFAPLATNRQALVRKSGLATLDLRPSWQRFRLRHFSWFANPILAPSELTDIYHFPYSGTTKTEDLVKAKSPALPAPLAFKQNALAFDAVFASNSYGGSETAIGLTLEERRRHTYILGATGTGKTTLMKTMVCNDIANGKGVAVIDPHGQLVEELLRLIPNERIKDVVWFSPDDAEHPVAINLMELVGNETLTLSQREKQKALIASSLISVFRKSYDERYFGPRMEYVLRNAILTALETTNPTLSTILDLLTQTNYRKHVTATLQNPVLRNFWVYEFEKLGSLQRNQMISPITNKLGGLLSSPLVYAILNQPKSTIDFAEVMDDGKILLCDLSKGKIGEDVSSFFGSLILAKLQLAALSRVRIPEAKRRDFFLYVDEFQNFATPMFGELVSEARKYRLSTILAHQSISQIADRDLVKTILANVGTVICFRTANPEDEQFILPIFSPEVSEHEITNLPLYTFYMKVSVGNPQDAFMAHVDKFPESGSDDTAEAVMTASQQQYGRSAEQQSPDFSITDPALKPKRTKRATVVEPAPMQPELVPVSVETPERKRSL